MTLQALLTKIKEEKPNSFSDEKLVGYVNEVESDVAHELGKNPADFQYKNDTESMSKILIAEPPYDRLYVSYLKAMIDYANEEYESYANNQAQHVQDYSDFTNWVVRTDQNAEQTWPNRLRNVM